MIKAKLLGGLAALMLVVPAFFVGQPATAATCVSTATPVGTANTSTDPEPTVPIFCVNDLVNPQQTGASDGFGGWIDNFNNTISGAQPAHLNNGEIGYNVYDNISADGNGNSQHWEANGYFGVDLAKSATFDGSDLSPRQSFTFQNGKLVLEADVSASEPGFANPDGSDVVWPEVDWSTSPTPNDSDTNDALYMYGYFKGSTAAGCRLQAHRSLTCAVEADHVLSSTTGDQSPCFSVDPSRVMEISGFQDCGSKHSGFAVDFGAPSNAWRVCPAGTVDPCMDRFRFEWSKTGMVAYVNGVKFAEDSNWPSYAQLPDAIVNGSVPVYAHFGDWGVFSDSNTYRFHWARVAVNPHNPDGTVMGPSASPTFGSPVPTPTPTPSPTPTPVPTSFPCVLVYGGVNHNGTCVINPDGSVTFR